MSEEIRQAASLIGVRDGSDGPEVLVIERTLDHRFLPGYVAFPGGAVDPADSSLAERWFGDATEASRAAAIRELVEEVGLAVTSEAIAMSTAIARSRGSTTPPLPSTTSGGRQVDRARAGAGSLRRSLLRGADGRTRQIPWRTASRRRRRGGRLRARCCRRGSPRRSCSYWPTHFTMSALAECRDAEEVLALQIVTREPDEDEARRAAPLGLLPRLMLQVRRVLAPNPGVLHAGGYEHVGRRGASRRS